MQTLHEVRLKPNTTWLVKPLASGGGHRVQPWPDAEGLPRDCYLQELVNGTPGSVVFVASGGRAVPIGVSRQLIGDRTFGAAGYRYCGNILAAAGDTGDAALVDRAGALARAVAGEFGVVGVNGIDFVARDGVPYAIEVNPRWCASMDLVERAYGLSVFEAHAAACANGVLPEFDLLRARRRNRARRAGGTPRARRSPGRGAPARPASDSARVGAPQARSPTTPAPRRAR